MNIRSVKQGVFILLAGVSLVTISSCTKSNSPGSGANVLFANGCVGATSSSLTVNGASLPNASSVAYLGSSGYQSTSSGSVTITDMLNGVGSLGSLKATLNTNSNYSVFDCGTVLADTLVLINDSIPALNGSYAFARLVNVSSDSTATSITGAVGNAVVGSGVPYGGASGFVQVAPGSFNITAFNVNKPGNVATLSGVQLSGGRVYTLMYSGNSSQSVGFKLTVINNN